MSPSSEFLQKTRAILRRCQQFQSDARLRAIFVDPRIKPWREQIQEAANLGERIDFLLDLLLECQNDQGESVFVLFLRVLGEAQPLGDSLHRDVLALAAEMEAERPTMARMAVSESISSPPVQPSVPTTIDREEAMSLFVQMMQPASPARILYLVGTAKMGKSHLLHTYRSQATSQHRALCALVDVRTETLSYSDILHQCCQQLRIPMPTYQAARDDLTRQHERNARGLNLLNIFTQRAQEGTRSQRHERHRLTEAFVKDLDALPDALPILLLFDSVEQAQENTRAWIIDDFLTALSPLAHVRVVLAGREHPDCPTTWRDMCIIHDLLPVALHHYEAYCASIGVPLDPERLAQLHRALKGSPGGLIEIQSILLAVGGPV